MYLEVVHPVLVHAADQGVFAGPGDVRHLQQIFRQSRADVGQCALALWYEKSNKILYKEKLCNMCTSLGAIPQSGLADVADEVAVLALEDGRAPRCLAADGALQLLNEVIGELALNRHRANHVIAGANHLELRQFQLRDSSI